MRIEIDKESIDYDANSEEFKIKSFLIIEDVSNLELVEKIWNDVICTLLAVLSS